MTIINAKKILLINTICGTGSTGRIVTGIYDELTSRGFVCMVAYGRWEAPAGYNAYRIGTDLDVNIHGVLSRITDRHGFYSKAVTYALINKIKEFGPDIIHLHNMHGYYLNIEILFKFLRNSGIKIIWTLHDCWSFTGHCAHFEFIGCRKWLTGCSNCEQKNEYPKSVLMDASKKNYEQKKKLFTGIKDLQLVTPSEWLKSKVAESYLKEYTVTVVPTGINLNVFQDTQSDLRERYGLQDKFLILGVANPWRDRKGLEDFKKLSRLISDKYKIVMIGLKPAQLKSMPSNIISLGKTDSIEEMAAWYSTADVYLNLTLEDTFPTTNIEALACGTPVITYKAGGSPESLTKDCGIVVAKRDTGGVMAALETLRLGENRKAACEERAAQYSSKIRFRQYFEEVYAQNLL